MTYGYLWLLDEDEAVDEEQAAVAVSLVERAGALLAQQARSREELDHTVADLLSADAEARSRAADTIHALGTVPPDSPVAAVVRRRPGRASRRVPGHRGGLPLTAEERARLVVGVGGLRRGLAEVRESWVEARLATRVAEVVPSARPVAVWPELGVYRLLACGPERALSSAVLDPAVRRLIEHGDPDLRRTALAFLDAGGNVQEAAAALTVHRQTVYYRVQKIEQVTGLDLARGDHRLLLHLGLTMAPFVVDPGDG